MAEKTVELGFAEKTENWRLLSHFFPHKIGGKPSWLCLEPVPTVDDVQCGVCGKSCSFLSQLYCPRSEKGSCFHRAVFVFVCKDPKCSKRNDNRNFVVLRSQLPRKNRFYSPEPPDEEAFDVESTAYPKPADFQSLCIVCGLSGSKKCSRCHKASYCSKEHQTIDWKAGHKKVCQEPDYDGVAACNNQFPEYEVITEPEEFETENYKSEEERLAEYENFVKNETVPGELNGGASLKDLEQMASGASEDKQFQKFKKRIDKDPDQVIRYDRDGDPLWVSAECQPTTEDIPDCSCGAKRKFEFQIMPYILSLLEVDSLGDSIDWGTLAVYTCSESCDVESYAREFVWKQDYSLDKES